MKQLIQVLCLALLMVACNKEKTYDYVKISGTITNPTSDSIVLTDIGKDNKVFDFVYNVEKNGTFIIDSLKLKESKIYYLKHDKKIITLYLKNGYDIELEWDGAEDVTLIGGGTGLKENKHHVENKPFVDETITKVFASMDLDSTSFNKLLDANAEKLIGLLESKKDLDTSFLNYERNRFLFYKRNHLAYYKNLHGIKNLNNKSAPKFVDFENHAGGTTSLSDFKGMFVFIDVWATWCGPCIAQVPYLKELEKEYHGKNIVFISISIDKKEAYDTWKNMVNDLELGGVQLYANEDKTFTEGYAISAIPRFILINPEGLIVSSSAPMPSDKKLIDLFNEAGI